MVLKTLVSLKYLGVGSKLLKRHYQVIITNFTYKAKTENLLTYKIEKDISGVIEIFFFLNFTTNL